MKLQTILRIKMFLPTLNKLMRPTWRDWVYKRYWGDKYKFKEHSIFEEIDAPVFKSPGQKKVKASMNIVSEISKLHLYKIVAYGSPVKYVLEDLLPNLTKLWVTKSAYHIKGETDLVHSVNEESKEPQETFIFRDGVVVFWNFINKDIKDVMDVLSKHQIFGYDIDNDMQASDIHYYKVTNKTRCCSVGADGVISIPRDNNFHVKYATSCMLATSVSLTIWQKLIQIYLSNILERVADDINLGYRISASERDVEQLQGSLSTVIFFMEINDQVYKPVTEDKESNVNEFHKELWILNSIPRRIKNVEKHLSHCKEICNLLHVLYSYKKHTNSFIIYYLITVSILILSILKYFNGIQDTKATRLMEELAKETSQLCAESRLNKVFIKPALRQLGIKFSSSLHQGSLRL
nr:required for meiotic nuclear division protein 1 homolog isoform X1 [Onthophagus taurus]